MDKEYFKTVFMFFIAEPYAMIAESMCKGEN